MNTIFPRRDQGCYEHCQERSKIVSISNIQQSMTFVNKSQQLHHATLLDVVPLSTSFVVIGKFLSFGTLNFALVKTGGIHIVVCNDRG